MDVEGAAHAEALVTGGHGRFWKVDERHLEKTIITPIQLRRITDKIAISTMTSGSEKDVRMLVLRTLVDWQGRVPLIAHTGSSSRGVRFR